MKHVSITWKLMLFVITIAILVTASMAFTVRYGFDYNLNQYQKAIHQDFQEQIKSKLVNHYQENHSWNILKNNRNKWHELIIDSYLISSSEHNQNSLPKLKDDTNHTDDEKFKRQMRGQFKKKRAMYWAFSTMALYDSKKNKIVGNIHAKQKNLDYQPIMFDTSIVGYLGIKRINLNRGGAIEKQFSHNIKNLLIISSVTILIFVATIGYPLAQYFTNNIKSITQATKQVTQGDYNIRLPTYRKDELGQLSHYFNQLTASLQQSKQTQKNMLTDIAHELRTPVSVLRSKIEAMQDGIHPMDAKALNMLHQQISELGHLINDIHELSLADIGVLSYHMETHDITDVTTNIIKQFHNTFQQAQLSIEQDLPEKAIWVNIDLQRFKQMLNNLINNSYRYTDKPGVMRIRITQHESQCILEIEDSSPGVSDRQLTHLFDRFYRTEYSRNKKSGGSGLGLSICQNIALAHKGQLTATHSILGGIKIKLTLPIQNEKI